MSKIYKIIHIHTDIKFAKSTAAFENKQIVNTTIVLGNIPKKQDLDVVFLKLNHKSLGKILKMCENADAVVLYNLCPIKSYIINKLNINTTVVWRFFGTELYSKIPNQLYSDLTKKHLRGNQSFIKRITKAVKSIYDNPDFLRFYFYSKTLKNNLSEVIDRVNLFMGLSKEEYLYLKKQWINLPEFLHIPISKRSTNFDTLYSKKNQIVVGNSRAPHLNHIDVLNIIQESEIKNTTFILPFNYGGKLNSIYSSSVISISKSIDNVVLLKDFLPFSEYKQMLTESSAIVINSYRQSSMANIYISIVNGVKVYLNKKNLMYDFLKNRGFLVFTLDDLKTDLKNNCFQLAKKDMEYNINLYNKIANSYTIEDFQKQLILKLKNMKK